MFPRYYSRPRQKLNLGFEVGSALPATVRRAGSSITCAASAARPPASPKPRDNTQTSRRVTPFLSWQHCHESKFDAKKRAPGFNTGARCYAPPPPALPVPGEGLKRVPSPGTGEG